MHNFISCIVRKRFPFLGSMQQWQKFIIPKPQSSIQRDAESNLQCRFSVLGRHSVMGLLFLFRWCVYDKFTCVPKYKPGISKLDYTNSSFCQISSSSRYIFSPVQVDGIDRPFSRTFCSKLKLTMTFCSQNFAWKLTKVLTLHYLLVLGDRERFFVKLQISHNINDNL